MPTTHLTQPGSATQVETWTIDPAHSLVEFSVKHMMIATVRGRFRDVAGTVILDPHDETSAAVDVTIDAASIDTGVAQRDGHLRSADFFDAETYPTLTYRSRRVEHVDDGVYRVVGDLTIRGVTREVVLRAEETGTVALPDGGKLAAFSASARISRRDFGLTWNQALETGGVLVGDDIKIALEVELVRAAAASTTPADAAA
jgi:polyisoprenoid-binding protein YceI